MRILSWILGLLVAGGIVLFAIANRHAVSLEFWPMPLSLEVPVYLAVLSSLILGVLLGMIIAWAAAGPARARNRVARRKAAALEREVENLRAEAALPALAAPRTSAEADSGLPTP